MPIIGSGCSGSSSASGGIYYWLLSFEQTIPILGSYVKTLSIGGRLTLLKSVLGATPIYSMSIFKVPHGVLKVMESIRARFFNGANQLDNKIAWVAWDKDGSGRDRATYVGGPAHDAGV
ncbi:hypothetical protein Tco_1308697, partial [Tanacetum coccineum]